MAALRRNEMLLAEHFLRCCLVVAVLMAVPDFIVALKDVSVTIPQAVKRGSNAQFICNYDMENDTLYSVKWYKGRREFYRYTPKENPAMKVFPMTSGLNVERNLSNQSHVVLLTVPLNISGKFTCEISVEAPSFQTAMVSGEMEVVELPEQQATVTGIQPRYRIGDLVDGNCSIKFSKPAANLTWTINGIVVPPHHIKTYQIEKYEENNLESVMSAIHFMVTTQHFVKGQMRLKCTASIFDIFKEEIESIIEEDRPRIMASGRSYDMNNYPYEHHGSGDGFEDHNESYLTYYSAADITSSASLPATQNHFLRTLQKRLKRIWTIIRVPTMNAPTARHCIRTVTLAIQGAWENLSDSCWLGHKFTTSLYRLATATAGACALAIILRHNLISCPNSKGRTASPALDALSKVATQKRSSKSLNNCLAKNDAEVSAAAAATTALSVTDSLQKWQRKCHCEENPNGGSDAFAACQQLSMTVARNRAVTAATECNFAKDIALEDQTLLMTQRRHQQLQQPERHFEFAILYQMAFTLKKSLHHRHHNQQRQC